MREGATQRRRASLLLLSMPGATPRRRVKRSPSAAAIRGLQDRILVHLNTESWRQVGCECWGIVVYVPDPRAPGVRRWGYFSAAAKTILMRRRYGFRRRSCTRRCRACPAFYPLRKRYGNRLHIPGRARSTRPQRTMAQRSLSPPPSGAVAGGIARRGRPRIHIHRAVPERTAALQQQVEPIAAH